MINFPHWKPRSRVKCYGIPQEMEYDILTERFRKTLHYGTIPKTPANFHSSLSLTSVIVEKFGERDNLYLEKLCFDYAADLSREAVLSPCSLVLALIYLERLSLNNPNFVSSVPSSKLFLVSVMIASKFINDEGEDDEVFNPDWAASARVELAELNQLERDFLQAINWTLFVDQEEFLDCLSKIETRIAQREGSSRGWLTYTDIDVLANNKLLVATWELIQNLVINVSLACLTAYLASVMTIFGSALVVSSLPWNQPRASPENPSFRQSTVVASTDPTPTTSINISVIPSELRDTVTENETSALLNGITELNSAILIVDIPALPGSPKNLSNFPHTSDPPNKTTEIQIRYPTEVHRNPLFLFRSTTHNFLTDQITTWFPLHCLGLA